MKGIDIFCASQAATSICLSTMDELGSSSTIHLGSGRAIDRYNPIIRDPRRLGKTLLHIPSCSTDHPPIFTPKPHFNHQIQNVNCTTKNSSSKPNNEKPNNNNTSKKKKKKKKKINKSSTNIIKLPSEEKRKSSAIANVAVPHDDPNNGSNSSFVARKSWSCSKPSDFISPPSSSRHLLSDHQAFYNVAPDFDPVLKLVEPTKSHQATLHQKDESRAFKVKPSSLSARSPDQVVVLRVSLHCKGCERKMRKHISRMEGVSSFNIDFAAKKVTVVGNVTPLAVLTSISKVKNAQLMAPAAAAVPSFTLPNSSEINKNNKLAIISS